MESKDKQPLTAEQLYEKYKCIVKNFNVSIGEVVIKESFLKALEEVSSPLLTRIAESEEEFDEVVGNSGMAIMERDERIKELEEELNKTKDLANIQQKRWIERNEDLRSSANKLAEALEHTNKLMIIGEKYSGMDNVLATNSFQEQKVINQDLLTTFRGENKKTMENNNWVCNQCNSEEYTGSVSEDDIQNLQCSTCGGDEFHKKEANVPINNT